MVLIFVNLINVDRFFHKFLDSDEFFEVLVAVTQQVRNIGNGDVQKPDHDIVLFLFEQETDINPEEDHKKGEEDGKSEEHVRVDVVKIPLKGVFGEGVINVINEVVVNVAKSIRLEPSVGLYHF